MAPIATFELPESFVGMASFLYVQVVATDASGKMIGQT